MEAKKRNKNSTILTCEKAGADLGVASMLPRLPMGRSALCDFLISCPSTEAPYLGCGWLHCRLFCLATSDSDGAWRQLCLAPVGFVARAAPSSAAEARCKR
ncbi:hypothetical protein MRX96_022999 [Rhipicephalus microplus]